MSPTDPNRPEAPAPVLERATAAEVTPYRILLLDVDSARRLRRTRALAAKGAKVDDVSTGSQARSRWDAGVHDMVLIEFQGARSEFDEFCDYLQASQPQRVAYFMAEPPYLTHSRRKGQAGKQPALAATVAVPAEAKPARPRQRTFGEAVKDAERQAGGDPS